MAKRNRKVNRNKANHDSKGKLPRAEKPFVFHTTMRLHEATVRKAKNLKELVEGIREVDGSVIFHHTYGSLLRYHFITPAPVSDFAFWVGNVLHNELMAEKLSGIDTMSFNTIAEIRQAHVKAIEEHLSFNERTAESDHIHGFHFVKGNSFVLSTSHTAWDLQSFRNCIENVTNDSLYFHLFEARLRLEKPTNDFSFWLGENLDEEKLAQFIARQDPYVQTLDNIKANILRELDKRLLELRKG